MVFGWAYEMKLELGMCFGWAYEVNLVISCGFLSVIQERLIFWWG